MKAKKPTRLEQISKRIVGKWGYEEPYWWGPIAAALKRERERAIRQCGEMTWGPFEDCNVDLGHQLRQ